jgi:cyclin-dependent kinase 2
VCVCVCEQPVNDMAESSRYEIEMKIGEGVYGIVYKALNKDTNKIVALKVTKRQEDEPTLNNKADVGLCSTSIREAAILKHLKHPNILCIENIFVERSRFYMSFEYMDEDLNKFIKRSVKMRHHQASKWPAQVKSLMYQIFSAMAYCRTQSVMHRDLKLQNILIDRDTQQLKVCDFGLARQTYTNGKQLTREVVSLWYRAPEIMLGMKHYSYPIDVWSIGCIFYECLTGETLLPGDTEIDQIFRTFKLFGTPSLDEWPEMSSLPDYQAKFPQFPSTSWWNESLHLKDDPQAIDLLKHIFVYNPDKRMTAAQALQHAYFDTFK